MKHLNHTEKTTAAFAGISNGTGTTWCAFAAAVYFSDIKNLRTCFVELSGKPDMAELFRGEKRIGDHYCAGGLDVYDSADKDTLVRVQNGRYQAIVLDLGTNAENEEMLRADLKIFVASVAPWKPDIFEFGEKIKKENPSFRDVRLFISFFNEKDKNELRSIPVKTGIVPLENNPLRLSKEMICFFKNMLF